MKKNLTIGVLGFQGDIEEHVAATQKTLQKIGVEGQVTVVKRCEEVEAIDGLIIPGGESTVIGSLSTYNKAIDAIVVKISSGMPTMGTCAGVIMLAKRTYDLTVGETRQPLIAALDATAERNTYGRQAESFEADLEIPSIGSESFRGVFIRAPSIKEVGANVQVLAKIGEQIVAVQQNNVLGFTFHPELTEDTRLHERFINMIIRNKSIFDPATQ
ncbi:MAG: pyridoxal 5'-phosphate synthase glutaminase subunit PdxT [Thaumarchaeota archaeon]|nr:pyridoxal 5'-phosphate synthase glutaminase subunit PdxT [Nitrososphaerota archaeon]MCL5317679.1 pyridoxal 5'-phosphate synthase glutaminase subunit PdxT [Nitrososphaerota archaeon]